MIKFFYRVVNDPYYFKIQFFNVCVCVFKLGWSCDHPDKHLVLPLTLVMLVGVWEVRIEAQVSKSEFHTNIHLDSVKVKCYLRANNNNNNNNNNNFINTFTIYMNYSFCQVHFYELVCTKHMYHQTKQSIIKYYFQH